jgi:hypothetical protein
VTDHLRPNAPKGSPEYRAVYFPTYDECMRRGGSAAMPGGLASAPWYLPGPPKPPSNPYNPPPPASSSGAASSGLPKPPAPPANPYNPTPPASSSSGVAQPPARSPQETVRAVSIDQIRAQCANAQSRAKSFACAIDICVRNAAQSVVPAQLGQFCSEVAGTTVGTQAVDYVQAELGVDGEMARQLASLLTARYAEGVERTGQALKGLGIASEPWARPAELMAFQNVRAAAYTVWQSLSLFVWDVRNWPCQVNPASCDGSPAISKGTGAQYFTLGQWCRVRINDVMQGAGSVKLSPAESTALVEAANRQCVERAPDDGQVRSLFASLAQGCLSASPDNVRNWSGGAASCLARLPQQLPPDRVYPYSAAIGHAVVALDYALRNCSASAGARWKGTAAEAVPGQTPPAAEFARRVQACMQELTLSLKLSGSTAPVPQPRPASPTPPVTPCPGAQCGTVPKAKAAECRRDENDGQTYCLNDSGQMCIQQSNGSCTHVADVVYVGDKPTLVPVPGQHITRGMAAFFIFRCPTCAFPNVDDPRRFPAPAAIVGVNGEFDVQDKFNFDSCKSKEGSDWAKVRQCFFEKCRQSRAGQSYTPTQIDASCARAFDHQKKRWNEYYKREIGQRFQNVPERVNEFWDAHGDTVVLAAVVVGGLALALFFPPAGGILAMGAAGTAGAVLIGVGVGSSGGAITGKAYGELGIQACRPTVERLVSEDPAVRALDPARHAAVKDFFIELCALNLPDVAQIRAMQRGTYEGCEQQSRYAQPVNGAPAIVAISRQLNNCLRSQSVQAAEKALLPRQAGLRFADQWSELLRGCAASSGMQWHGDLENGAAWPVGYSTGGDALLPISACMQSSIR